MIKIINVNDRIVDIILIIERNTINLEYALKYKNKHHEQDMEENLMK